MSTTKQRGIGLTDAEKAKKRDAKTLPNLFSNKDKLQALADPRHPAAKSIIALTAELLPLIIKDFSGTIEVGAMIEWFRERLFGDGLTPDGRRLAYSKAALLSDLSPELLGRRDAKADALGPDGQPANDRWFKTMARIDRPTARNGKRATGSDAKEIYANSIPFRAIELYLTPSKSRQFTCEVHTGLMTELQISCPAVYSLLDAGLIMEAYDAAVQIHKMRNSCEQRDLALRCIAAEAHVRKVEDLQRVHAEMVAMRRESVPTELRGEVEGSQKLQMAGIFMLSDRPAKALLKLLTAFKPKKAPEAFVGIEGRTSPLDAMFKAAAKSYYRKLDSHGRSFLFRQLAKLKLQGLRHINKFLTDDARLDLNPDRFQIDPKIDVLTHWLSVPERTFLLVFSIRILQSRAITQRIFDDPDCLISQGFEKILHPKSLYDMTGIGEGDPQLLCSQMIELQSKGAEGRLVVPAELSATNEEGGYEPVLAARALLRKFEKRRATGYGPRTKAEIFFDNFDPFGNAWATRVPSSTVARLPD